MDAKSVNESRYETIDSKSSAKGMRRDIDLVTFLPPNKSNEKNTGGMAYVNEVVLPVAHYSEDEHVYESPRQTGEPKRRARINEMYDGGESNGSQLTNTQIFEEIRHINFGSTHTGKNRCHCKCFALIFLLILLVLSLGSSSYVLYKVEFQQFTWCRNDCGLPERQAFTLSNGKTNQSNVSSELQLLSNDIKRIKKSIRALEKQVNATKVVEMERALKNNTAILKNNIAALKNNTAELLKVVQIEEALKNYFAELSKTSEMGENFTVMLLAKENQIQMSLSDVNVTIMNEIESLREKLATKGSFKNCTLEMETKDDTFKDSSLIYVEMPRKAQSKYKILGVGCTVKGVGEVDSQLEIQTDKAGSPVYKCAFERQKASVAKHTCIMYYWQCPNN